MPDVRHRILRDLWEHIRSLHPETVDNVPAAARLIAYGADPVDVARAMSVAAYEATFNALFVLTSEDDIRELAASGEIVGLHEDLLSRDPTGNEGSDLFS